MFEFQFIFLCVLPVLFESVLCYFPPFEGSLPCVLSHFTLPVFALLPPLWLAAWRWLLFTCVLLILSLLVYVSLSEFAVWMSGSPWGTSRHVCVSYLSVFSESCSCSESFFLLLFVFFSFAHFSDLFAFVAQSLVLSLCLANLWVCLFKRYMNLICFATCVLFIYFSNLQAWHTFVLIIFTNLSLAIPGQHGDKCCFVCVKLYQ